jgi:hypothetical protein
MSSEHTEQSFVADIDMEDSDEDEEIDEEENEEDDDEAMETTPAPSPGSALTNMMSSTAAAASSGQEQQQQEEDAAVQKRRAIQAIMRDTSISDAERRMRIQNLMSGGRTEVVPPSAPAIPQQDSSTCVHYQRNCSIVAPCCNGVFGCRVCHDEMSPTGHPPMNRFMIQEVVCKQCNTRQSSAT